LHRSTKVDANAHSISNDFMTQQLSGIGPYHLKEVLGGGARAVVYRAIKDGRSEEFAVKVMHNHLVEDDVEITAFVERTECARKLNYPEIPTLYEVVENHRPPYLARELVEGISLDTLTTGAKLSSKGALALIRGILDILAKANTEGIAHGRLDAGNILIDHDGGVWITGFGMTGTAETDLLAIARIVQALPTKWPTEMDAWLDEFQGHSSTFTAMEQALDALPIPSDKAHVSALGRAVRRKRKADKVKSETVVETNPPAPDVVPHSAKETLHPAQITLSLEPTESEVELDQILPQARWMAALCAGMFLLAFIIEIF
jgi:serine/threonine protein kinase